LKTKYLTQVIVNNYNDIDKDILNIQNYIKTIEDDNQRVSLLKSAISEYEDEQRECEVLLELMHLLKDISHKELGELLNNYKLRRL